VYDACDMQPKLGVSLVTATLLAACGGRTVTSEEPAGMTFPVGTWTHCAEGTHADNGVFLNSGGYVPDASLSLSQSGSTLSARLEGKGELLAFDFDVTTRHSAALAHSAQPIPGFGGFCVQGVGVSNEVPFDATLEPSAGALTYDAGAVFLSIVGIAQGNAGDCGPAFARATYWLSCAEGPAPVLPFDAYAAASSLLVGSYTCASQVHTHFFSDGVEQYAGSGADGGTLTVALSGQKLVATYSGDKFVSGSLELEPTTSTTASAALGQSLTLACEVPIASSQPPSQAPEAFPVAAASLALYDNMLVLTFVGTAGESSSCPGAEKAATLSCSK